MNLFWWLLIAASFTWLFVVLYWGVLLDQWHDWKDTHEDHIE